MNAEEIRKVFDILTYNVKGFSYDKGTFMAWAEELSQYDADDVFSKLKELLAERIFQTTTPTVYYLIKGLRKTKDKIDYTQTVFYCRLCGRPFNSIEAHHEHEDRCSSVKYILKQYLRFGLNPIPNKRDLFEMSEDEFDKKYKELLKIVYNKTTDKLEKIRIEFIFNPPKKEVAKDFIGATE